MTHMDDSSIFLSVVAGALLVTILAMPESRDGFSRGARLLLDDRSLRRFARIGVIAALGGAILAALAFLS